MKLSIIIVSYNEKEYLKEAIESCINQNFRYDYEIIIGDDGSNDGSIDVIQGFQKKFPEIIHYFVMERGNASDVIPSLRVTNVLKSGFSMAKGEFITVLSGDDLILDHSKFEMQVEFLEHHPQYVSCYTDFKKFGKNQKDIVFENDFLFGRAVFWAGKYVHISCFVFRKIVTSYLLDRFADDTGLMFSILKAGKSKHIKGICFGYRQRDASIMHEADELELSILELMLYQDIMNAGGYKFSSLSRFMMPLNYVYRHRTELSNDKYKKYLMNCKALPNNILGDILEYGKLSEKRKTVLRLRNIISKISRFVFRVVMKAETILVK